MSRWKEEMRLLMRLLMMAAASLDKQLVFHDLTTTKSDSMPPLVANLSKPDNVPSVIGGALWPDNVNKKLYM